MITLMKNIKEVHLQSNPTPPSIHEIKMSMLKFRLPYCTKEKNITAYEYLKGEIFLPIWGPVVLIYSKK
jgi:hypothetical protein